MALVNQSVLCLFINSTTIYKMPQHGVSHYKGAEQHQGPHSRNFLGKSQEDFLSQENHKKIFSKALISN